MHKKYIGNDSGVELIDTSDFHSMIIEKFFKSFWFFKRYEYWLKLLDDAWITFRLGGRVYKWTVFKGYEWDGSSIPGFAHGLPTIGSPTSKTNRKPSCFHDNGYGAHHNNMTKEVVDDLFGLLIDWEGGNPIIREGAVEIFGGFFWGKTKKEILKERKMSMIEEIEMPMQGNSSHGHSIRRGAKVNPGERF